MKPGWQQLQRSIDPKAGDCRPFPAYEEWWAHSKGGLRFYTEPPSAKNGRKLFYSSKPKLVLGPISYVEHTVGFVTVGAVLQDPRTKYSTSGMVY